MNNLTCHPSVLHGTYEIAIDKSVALSCTPEIHLVPVMHSERAMSEPLVVNVKTWHGSAAPRDRYSETEGCGEHLLARRVVY